MKAVGRALFRSLMEWASRPYVIGPQLADAMAAAGALAARGCAATISPWNREDDGPQDNLRRYVETIDAIAANRLDCYLSLEAPNLDFSPELTRAVGERAAERGIGVHLDSHGHDTADRLYGLLEKLPRGHGVTGCTIPGRWRRSLADADRAVALDLRVRIVKGIWGDPAEPHADLRAGFLRVVDRLAGRVRHAAVATHDAALARAALARLKEADTPCELEVLYGMPMRRAITTARSMQVPVRIYLPYGRAWRPYALRQLHENPRIAWWVVRDVFRAGPWRGAQRHARHP